jgi:hypothetical protein
MNCSSRYSPSSGQTIADLNAKIDDGIANSLCWATSPLDITNHFFSPKDHERYYNVEFNRTAAGAEVIVTIEGLQDDSVFGERRKIEFVEVNQRWYIKTIGIQVKCQDGRGHSSYSEKSCS